MPHAAFILRSLLAALVLALAPAAAAQDDAQAGARAAFASAERAFEEHDYELALELFRRAQALRPHDAVRFNVAVCLERLGQFREALGEYELAWASLQLPEATREEARRHAERIRARLGTLTFAGEAGTSVRAGALSCAVPCTLELDPGVHRIEIARDGRSVTREVRVARGGSHSIDTGVLEAGLPETGAREGDVGARGWNAFGVMTAIGGVALAIGGGATIGFGLHTEGLASSYSANPSLALRDEGLTMRALTNASIAVAAVGLALVAIDLVVWLVDPPRGPASAARRGRIVF